MADPKPKPERSGLPKGDLLVLPLIALATAALIVGPAEIAARVAYPDRQVDRCVNIKGPVAHGVAGCSSRTKVPEGPWVTNTYNDCGYRSPQSCGPKPSGALRVAIVGSSTGGGFLVPEPVSMSGRAPAALSAACRRPVEIQNLAVAGVPLKKLALSAREALTLSPDALVVVVTSTDLANAIEGPPKPKPLFRKLADWARLPVNNSRLLYMAKAIILGRESDYTSLIAAQKTPDADLRHETAEGIEALAGQLEEIVGLARADNVPVVMAFIPKREELVRSRLRVGGNEPVIVDLQALAASKGVPFIDTLAAIPKAVPSSELYYVVNHHMDGRGHAYLAKALETGVRSSVPAFRACSPP